MRISRFYCPEFDASSEQFILPDAVHRHAIQVLRLKKDARLRLFNGRGLEYEVELVATNKRESQVSLVNKVVVNNESALEITLLQAISRGERMDYALQKAVELGVSAIVPVLTERCNVQLSNGRAEKRRAHWQGVIISACEQSGRRIVPQLSQIMTVEEALAFSSASCQLVLDPLAKQGFRSIEKQDEIALLIGPEGGLSEQELSLANNTNFQSVQFGPRILRTETATVAALAVVQTLWGDLG